VEVGEGALDDPADGAQAGAVPGSAAGDDRCDSALADESTVLAVVVAVVADNPVRSAAWPADDTSHRGHPVEQRDQLGDVVAVATGQREPKRDPGLVDEQVVL
jgi:hypothetical protein